MNLSAPPVFLAGLVAPAKISCFAFRQKQEGIKHDGE